MKRFPKRSLFLTILILVFLVCPFISIAQPEAGCTPDNYRWDGKEWIYCPFDNGLFALLGVAVLYGIKKVKDVKKVTSD